MSEEDIASQDAWDSYMRGESRGGSPSGEHEGDDVKVPIEVEDGQDEKDLKGQEADGQAASTASPEQDEDAMVEAAKRAGERAAEEDMKADAQRVRKERDELQKKLDEVSDEIASAKKEAADSAERLVRLQADWDNYRRRTAQERLDERERAAEKLVTNLLPVLDDMERASEHALQSAGDDENLKTFVEGVDAVHDKMLSILKKEGVEVIDPVGKPFDPLIHQAVGREENKDAYDETVAQVYQKGYSMGGKVIRSAMVTVTYGGPKRPAEAAEDDSSKAASGDGGDDGGAQDPGQTGSKE